MNRRVDDPRALQLDVLGPDGEGPAAEDELEPFLRVWARLYPDVAVEVGTPV